MGPLTAVVSQEDTKCDQDRLRLSPGVLGHLGLGHAVVVASVHGVVGGVVSVHQGRRVVSVISRNHHREKLSFITGTSWIQMMLDVECS